MYYVTLPSLTQDLGQGKGGPSFKGEGEERGDIRACQGKEGNEHEIECHTISAYTSTITFHLLNCNRIWVSSHLVLGYNIIISPNGILNRDNFSQFLGSKEEEQQQEGSQRNV